MWFGSQVDQIWLADDRKATNIEVRGVVSIETDLVWKRSPSEAFFFFLRKKAGRIIEGGGDRRIRTTTKSILLSIL